MQKSVLINCSNLHGGGGVAVAVSFVSHLSDELSGSPLLFSLLLSTKVYNALLKRSTDLSAFNEITIRDWKISDSLSRSAASLFSSYEVVFTVFGPLYTIARIPNHVVGFARPHLIYPPWLYTSRRFSLLALSLFLRNIFLVFFFLNSSVFVVEANHIADRLRKVPFLGGKPIRVVSNTFDSLYLHYATNREALPPRQDVLGFFPGLRRSAALRFGIVSRSYPHKNLVILSDVARILRRLYSIDCEICVTLRDDEWLAMPRDFRAAISNVGELSPSCGPYFYSVLDGMIFPSLLECFSASPLEAMAMSVPVFASRLPFVEECYGDNVYYFDPRDPMSIASSIVDYLSLPEFLVSHKKRQALEFSLRQPPSRDRCLSYMEIINEQFDNTE